MRRILLCTPIAAILIAGSALAQTAQPDTSRTGTPGAAPDSARISQRCTTTGLSSDAAVRCPDDVLIDLAPPGAPQVIAPPAIGLGSPTIPAASPATAGSGPAPSPATRSAPSGSSSGR